MKPAMLAGLLCCAAVLWYVRAHDPANGGGYGLPSCTFKELTGYHCPGCGGTRSAHALLNGRLSEAFYFNPLFIAGLTVGSGFLIRARLRKRKGIEGQRITTKQGVGLALAIIGTIIGFGIVRNFAWFPWLKAPVHQRPLSATQEE